LRAVSRLSRRDQELHRLAQLVAQQVNLARQTSAGTPQSRVRAPFFLPVAACWWARTMVESIIRYSFCVSCVSVRKICSQTPEAAQRANRLCTLLYFP
jgi:hypothetical protein